MSERTLRVGIIGCGKIAQTHAEAVTTTPGAALVACCDADLASRAGACGRFRRGAGDRFAGRFLRQRRRSTPR